MDTIEQTLDFSTFANYGTNVEREIHAEVLLSLLTRKGSVAGYREFGTEIQSSVNAPLNLQRFLLLLTQSIESLQKYNDSAATDTERRVSVDSEAFEFDVSSLFQGIASMSVYYIRLRDLVKVTV